MDHNEKASLKKELRDAAANGISAFLGSTRGAWMAGAGSDVREIKANVLQVACPSTSGGPTYFNITVSERI